MPDFESRTLSLVHTVPEPGVPVDPGAVSVEAGLADVVTLQQRRQARISAHGEERFFLDMLSEYPVGRGRSGLAQEAAQEVVQLTDFRTQALARLAAQHEEVGRLREAAAATTRVSRLPPPRTTATGTCG
ncbi:hypothetical protein ACIA74_21040 [Streptomyces sp. NPDC051658]|uniref:hypothetical protein n=1 Tax=Streptomyces sp. NPDC051658 TaxID=3365667 RepID=UPI0037BBE9C9